MYRTSRLTSGDVANMYYYGIVAKRHRRNVKMAKTVYGAFKVTKQDITTWGMVVDCINRSFKFEEKNKNSRRAQII